MNGKNCKRKIESVCAYILAGGLSTRMGRQKQFVSLHGKTLLEHVIEKSNEVFCDVALVVNRERPARPGEPRRIVDHFHGMGPLAGIYTALVDNNTPEHAFIVASDMPFISTDYILALFDSSCSKNSKKLTHDIVSPGITVNGDVKTEPLHSFYSKRCAPYIKSMLKSGEKRARELIKNKDLASFIHQTPASEATCFFNINCQDDMDKAMRMKSQDTLVKW